jgi:hypothetical protein
VTWQAEIKKTALRDQPGQNVRENPPQLDWARGVLCENAPTGVPPQEKVRPSLKDNQCKKAVAMALGVEHLPRAQGPEFKPQY